MHDQKRAHASTRSDRISARHHTDNNLPPHQPRPLERGKLHNVAHTHALAQPKRRTGNANASRPHIFHMKSLKIISSLSSSRILSDVSSRDFPSSRPSATTTTTGQRNNNDRKRVQEPNHQRSKDKGYTTLQDLSSRSRIARPGQPGNNMSPPPPPPPPLHDLPVSPVSLKSAVFQFADVYPREGPEIIHMEKNEGRRYENDDVNNDNDWIEVAEELLAQTPIDGSGREQ